MNMTSIAIPLIIITIVTVLTRLDITIKSVTVLERPVPSTTKATSTFIILA
jgi:hypothetical protein